MSASINDESATLVQRIAPQYRLRGLAGPAEGKVFVLPANTVYGKTVIGRSSECAIVLQGSGISRRHAAIQVKDGIVMLEDLGSSNGTYVDGVRIQQATPLSPGQEIGFELLRFVFEYHGGPAAEQPTTVFRSGEHSPVGQALGESAEKKSFFVVGLIAALVVAAALGAGLVLWLR